MRDRAFTSVTWRRTCRVAVCCVFSFGAFFFMGTGWFIVAEVGFYCVGSRGLFVTWGLGSGFG